MLNFMALYWPQGLKRIPTNLGSQFATLGAKQQAKYAQSWPQVFPVLTPSFKQAIVAHQRGSLHMRAGAMADPNLKLLIGPY
jgi:hypothetical protein